MEAPSDTRSYRVRIVGIPPETTEGDIASRFKSFGSISDVYIARGDPLLRAEGRIEGK